ncbi:MAG: anion permease [Opitutales bacterium]|nr:anion permease [Opitutales bacterium]
MSKAKITGLILGLIALIAPFLFPMESLWFPGAVGLGIFGIAAIFWIFECVPIWATSLLVIFLQIVLLSDESPIISNTRVEQLRLDQAYTDGVWLGPDTALEDSQAWVWNNNEWIQVPLEDLQSYSGETGIAVDADDWKLTYDGIPYSTFFNSLASPILMLFLGGFFLAAAAVKYRLDQNITRMILSVVGNKPAHIILGLMSITALLSSFMSNTATAAMMITVVIPLTALLKKDDPLRHSLILAIPCGANIGGIATPIGSPPNAVALSALNSAGISISFSQWMLFMTPLAVVMIVIAWRGLLWMFRTQTEQLRIDMSGGWDRSPKALATYVIFCLTIFFG